MEMQDLRPAYGSTSTRRRIGRGIGSGLGKTAGKGHKGQKARTGGKIRRGFEGGQTPLYRRIPKRGFNNSVFTTEYAIINVSDLEKFDNGTVVNMELLLNEGMIRNPKSGLKVLGNGNLTKTITVEAKKVSNSAREKIEACGGKTVSYTHLTLPTKA